MIEVNIIWRFVDTHPRNGVAGFPRFADRSQFRAQGFDLRVTIHAGLCSWNIGVGGFLYPGVTIAAIHPELIDVEGMIEGYRLSWLVANPGVFGRKVIGHSRNHTGRHHGNADQDFDREPVGPSWENVGHEGWGTGKSVEIRGLG